MGVPISFPSSAGDGGEVDLRSDSGSPSAGAPASNSCAPSSSSCGGEVRLEEARGQGRRLVPPTAGEHAAAPHEEREAA